MGYTKFLDLYRIFYEFPEAFQAYLESNELCTMSIFRLLEGHISVTPIQKDEDKFIYKLLKINRKMEKKTIFMFNIFSYKFY